MRIRDFRCAEEAGWLREYAGVGRMYEGRKVGGRWRISGREGEGEFVQGNRGWERIGGYVGEHGCVSGVWVGEDR